MNEITVEIKARAKERSYQRALTLTMNRDITEDDIDSVEKNVFGAFKTIVTLFNAITTLNRIGKKVK